MKVRNLLTLILLFASTIFIYAQDQSFKIMTYNIRNGIGMDLKTDFKRTADVINKYQPDLVAIQEVDSMTNRSGNKYVLEEIASYTNMHHFFASAINYDGGKYGIGIMTKDEPISVSGISLPGREEERALIIAEFPDYYFICTHLSLTPEDQETSIQIIDEKTKGFNKPIFIAGDFNAEPASATIKDFQKKFSILSPIGGKTYPADIPTEAIDYIAIDKNFSKKMMVTESFVVEEPAASDHRPIVVKVAKK